MEAAIPFGPARLGAIALAALALAGPAGGQGPVQHSAALVLSSERAGARDVEVALWLGYEMQCGYPGPGPVVVTFPAAEGVPVSIRAAAVLVDGKPAPSVHVSGRTVSIALAPPPQIMCDEIGPGRLTVKLTRAARLRNPGRAGSYLLRAARGSLTFTARFTVRTT